MQRLDGRRGRFDAHSSFGEASDRTAGENQRSSISNFDEIFIWLCSSISNFDETYRTTGCVIQKVAETFSMAATKFSCAVISVEETGTFIFCQTKARWKKITGFVCVGGNALSRKK